MRLSIAILTCALAACAVPAPPTRVPDTRADYHAPGVSPPTAQDAERLWSDANHVFERRCVVCHGCYDAPCQLKLETFAGVERGATTARVYDPARLTAAQPTRLFVDAQTLSEWRAKGFHSVLPDNAVVDPRRSVMLRMLELKRAHPLGAEIDVEHAFTLDLDREQTCTDAEHFDAYADAHPLWGMPYALPQLEESAHARLVAWLRAGAAPGKPLVLSDALQHAVARWENFFNDPAPKSQLMARYIYEHLFIGSLYFKGVDEHTFFRLVRSHTPSGYAVDELPTRRPFEDPGPGRFYYRLVQRLGAPLAKTHMPYALDAARMARYRALFLEPEYTVDALPSYEPDVAANPLRAFAALPVGARYRFLLDDAEFTMMGFIKGPVCRGQVALNAIQERFWITFMAPDAAFMAEQTELLRDTSHDLELPADAGSNALPLRWLGLSKEHARYVKRKQELLRDAARTGRGLDVDSIWDGNGTNANAALTVFRHFDSATVVRGLVGGPPKTAWVVDYPMFERIHYLLVAGFDAFGNLSHQLLTRMYMDFLRMEGESNLLSLLPKPRRRALIDAWYKRVSKEVKAQAYAELADYAAPTKRHYHTTTPELELYAALQTRLAAIRDRRFELHGAESDELHGLDGFQGLSASFMPELSFLAVEQADGVVQYFTVLRESAHTNVAQLFNEDERRIPAEDALCVVPGFLGAYPNALFRMKRTELTQFVQQVKRLDADGYRALRARFGVSRASTDFWSLSDAMHEAYYKAQPLEAGLFDYNRLAAY